MLQPPNELAFLYVKDKIKPIVYNLILKTDVAGTEVWLKTFYRIKRKQYPKKLNPDQIIQDHFEEEFMG